MKTLPFRPARPALIVVATLMMSALGPLRAQDHGFYLQNTLGPAIAHDVKVNEFAGLLSNTKAKLDAGIHFGLVGGYNVNPFLSAELETGIIANNIDRIGTDFPDASLSHVPFLVNVVLRYETEDSTVVPYVGVGVGGDSSVLIINDSMGLDGSDSDVVFACQAIAGVRFRINDRMSLGAGYKFFHAGNPSWNVRDAPGAIRFGHADVHAFGVVFNWKL